MTLFVWIFEKSFTKDNQTNGRFGQISREISSFKPLKVIPLGSSFYNGDKEFQNSALGL